MLSRGFSVVVTLALSLSGCTPGSASPHSDTACDTAFADAAANRDNRATDDAMDPAVGACGTLDDWLRASAKYPKALDGADATQFLRDRCQLTSRLSTTPLCKSVLGGSS